MIAMPILPKLASAVALAALAACSTTSRTKRDVAFPLHVAVAPVQVSELTETDVSASNAFTIKLDAGAVDVSLARELGGGLFARVTTLEYPADKTTAEFAAARPEAQFAHWVRSARAADADVLLVPALSYRPEIEASKDVVNVAVNLPVFLFLGPVSYWVADARYDVQAELVADLFDVTMMDESGRFSSWQLLTKLRRQFGGTRYDYNERVDRALDYLLTVIVPPSFLETRTDQVVANLREDVVADLSASIVDQLADDRRRVLMPMAGASFCLAPGEMHATRYEDGTLVLEGPVYQTAGSGRLAGYSVFLGDQTYDRTFRSPVPVEERPRDLLAGGLRRYELSDRVPDVGAGVESVRIEIRDSGTSPRVRSFSCQVREASGPCPSKAQAVEGLLRREPAPKRAVEAGASATPGG
jgi:hypothetical protein